MSYYGTAHQKKSSFSSATTSSSKMKDLIPHWTQLLTEVVVLAHQDGTLGLTIKGGADFGEFPYLGKHSGRKFQFDFCFMFKNGTFYLVFFPLKSTMNFCKRLVGFFPLQVNWNRTGFAIKIPSMTTKVRKSVRIFAFLWNYDLQVQKVKEKSNNNSMKTGKNENCTRKLVNFSLVNLVHSSDE